MGTQSLHQCRHEGRLAFMRYGIKGANRHSYQQDSYQRQAFIEAYDMTRMNAAEQAQREAVAYHALSVRDNASDRIWAAKLAQA